MNRNATCVLTCTYKAKTEKALKVHVKNEGKFFWLPISQIPNIYLADEDTEVDIVQMTPEEEYVIRIPIWLACRLLQVDSAEELEELELSYLDLD